jgi:competence ComEA-like helix-hairpin-helix protein
MPLSFASSPGSRPIPWALLFLMLILVSSGCVKRSRDPSLAVKSAKQSATSSQATNPQANDQQSGDSPHDAAVASQADSSRININIAPARELERLPGIGQGLAERIISHREKFGPFRRPEHLIIVRGISDKRFRALRDLITVQ